jgi:hypothetical protein
MTLNLEAMPLTDIEIRKSKTEDKAYRLPDGKGLYLSLSRRGESS